MDWDKALRPTYWRKQPARGMQEVLPVLDAPTNEYADLQATIDARGLHVVTLPAGYLLYKGRFKPTQLLQSEHNPYADKVAWFGPKGVADGYNGDRTRRFLTYELKVLKPLTLVLLLHTGNAKFVVGALVDRIKNGDEAAKTLLTGFCMGTGFGVTYDEQLAFYRDMEKTYTPTLVNEAMHDLRLDIGDGAFTSRLRSDFHRVSIRTSIDTDMANAICTTCGYDGYLMRNTPTFLCQKEFCTPTYGKLVYLNEEIALCNQRGIEISIGGRIPDYLGMQAAIFHDKKSDLIAKYFLPSRAVRMVVERERVASKALLGKPYMAPFTSFRQDPKTGYIVATRKAWDNDLAYVLMNNTKAMTVAKLKHYFQQVVRACRIMAERGVVHGDMKLENILTRQRSDAIAISDFGTAKVVSASYKSFHITEQDKTFLAKKYDFYSFCLHFWVMCVYLEQHPAVSKTFHAFRTTVLETFLAPTVEVSGTYFEVIEALRASGYLAYHTWPHNVEPMSWDDILLAQK